MIAPKNKTPAKPNCIQGLTGVFSQAVKPPGHSAYWHSSQPGFVYFLEVDASRALQSDFVVFVAVNRIHLALFQRFLVLKYTEIVRALVVVLGRGVGGRFRQKVIDAGQNHSEGGGGRMAAFRLRCGAMPTVDRKFPRCTP